MQDYAHEFNKGLQNKDIKYYVKTHHERGAKGNMHAHILVSRKDVTNNVKISHRAEKTGTAKGGFCRNDFY